MDIMDMKVNAPVEPMVYAQAEPMCISKVNLCQKSLASFKNTGMEQEVQFAQNSSSRHIHMPVYYPSASMPAILMNVGNHSLH